MNATIIIAFGLFIILIIIMHHMTKGGVWLLKDLTLDEDEKIYGYDDVIKYETIFRHEQNKHRYPRGHIMITNKRIILSQKQYGAKNSFRITHSIDFHKTGTPLTAQDLLGGSLFKKTDVKENFLRLYTTTKNINNTQYKSSPIIDIAITYEGNNAFFNTQPHIRIYTNNTALYQQAGLMSKI